MLILLFLFERCYLVLFCKKKIRKKKRNMKKVNIHVCKINNIKKYLMVHVETKNKNKKFKKTTHLNHINFFEKKYA